MNTIKSINYYFAQLSNAHAVEFFTIIRVNCDRLESLFINITTKDIWSICCQEGNMV